MKKRKIILIGNYALDHQESMERFSIMLKRGFESQDYFAKLIRPMVLLGYPFFSTSHGIAKWLGYIDKWILYPFILIFYRLKYKNFYFHVCDHSNAYYMRFLPSNRSSITCHDVLAIRGALGYNDAFCPSTKIGMYFQKWILRNLIKCNKIACVSSLTKNHLINLAGNEDGKFWKVIYNGFNAPFKIIPDSEIKKRFKNNRETLKLEKSKFLLHVGSGLPRKNRQLLVKMLVELNGKWDGLVCFAGKPIDRELAELIKNLDLSHRIVSVVSPDHDLLEAIFNKASFFIFPSFSEGFGWPLIEAQACGTPVIASNLMPMPEVGADGAFYASPYDPKEFAEIVLKENDISKNAVIKKGFDNIERYNFDNMINNYLKFFKA